jgi:amino acid adenylation domain-containing protein
MKSGSVGIMQVLARARMSGISLSLKGAQLSVKLEKGRLPDESILEEIKGRRDEIVRFLEGQQDDPAGAAMMQGRIVPAASGYTGKAPLSYAQERIWIIDRLKGTPDYHLPVVLRWKGPVDRRALYHAIRTILERHHILRTRIKEENGSVYQDVRDAEEWVLDYRDDIQEGDAVQRYIEDFVNRPFDLSNDYMLRAGLLKINENQHLLTIVNHHIASDGLSVPLMVNEFVELYCANREGRRAELPELKIQYADYATWQRRYGESLSGGLAYWNERLRGAVPLELPLDKVRPAMQSVNGDVVEIEIGKELKGQLNRLSREEGVTLFMLLVAVCKTLLFRYSGQQDISVGTPVANRTHRETEGLIGFFTNTLVLRTTLEGKMGFRELLKQIKQNTLEAYNHMDVAFEKIVEQLADARDMSRSPLFQVMFVLQNTPPVPMIPGVTLSVEPLANTTSKFEMTFDITELEEGMKVRIEYNTDLWRRETVNRIARHYAALLQAVVSHADERIGQLNMLTDAERTAMLSPLKDRMVSYAPDRMLVDLFEEQVLSAPDHIAIVDEDREWTYRELNEQANRLAGYLRIRRQVGRDDLVGLLQEKGERMIVGMLGILKAGGGYMPVDPEYPADRIGFMISDSGCKVLLDEKEWGLFQEEEVLYGKEDLPWVNLPGDLAYVIYTSGTTGRPKGVLIEHRNVVQLVKNERFRSDFGPGDVWTLFHSFCFDFSVWEMYGALLYGGKLVLVPRAVARDPESFLRLLEKERVTMLNQTPSAFYNLIGAVAEKGGSSLAVRTVIFGGEALSPGRLKEWHLRYPRTRLINMYGITETTVHVTYKEIGEAEITSDLSNIGAALPGVSCYVLDAAGGLLPVGIPGELYVGGTGVGRGYLNREELTGQRFIAHPFKEGQRLYRSGDRVKLLDNGEMEYLGRIDEQVKIRGYRIELGEIESALRDHPGIGSAVAVARVVSSGEKELVAYIVGRDGAVAADGEIGEASGAGELTTSEINVYLKDRLPAYMVPAHYVLLESLPLTGNGKIDKKSLPDPEGLSLPTGMEYIAPGNEIEAKLVKIWQEILGKEKIGIKDNFFEAGGNSIKLIKMVGMVNKVFQERISVVSAFKLPNIHALSAYLQSKSAKAEGTSVEELKKSVDIMKGTLNLLKKQVYEK